MKNIYVQYAKKHNCSVTRAIADRDYPYSREQCRLTFLEATGRNPTDTEMAEMNPDSNDAIQRWISDNQPL